MNGKENIIIVKSDPGFEWERKAAKRAGKGKKALKKTLSCLLVTALAFSGAVGGMFVYDEFIAEDASAGGVLDTVSADLADVDLVQHILLEETGIPQVGNRTGKLSV